jgi:hypothetical protein
MSRDAAPAGGTADHPTVPALGGTRLVPEPDPVARDYLLLALRLGQHIPGLVDGYVGPAALKAQVDMEQLRAPGRLRDDAIALRDRVANEVTEPDRRTWLDAQLVALETHAQLLAGASLPYAAVVERYMGFAPARHDEAWFAAARADLDTLLPGPGTLDARLDAWDAALTIAEDRLPAVIDWLVARCRAAAAAHIGLPADEALRVSLVRDQPWGAYAWFDGGGRSRIDVNIDRPIRAPDLVRTIAHETYPGHHLEHAWKEAELVDRVGRLEASILLINTPECPISEGLADIAVDIAAPEDAVVGLLDELFERAGSTRPRDPAERLAMAQQASAVSLVRRRLSAIRGNAAWLRHADGRSRDDVVAYLHDVGGFGAERAAAAFGFLDHPTWRTYVFTYDAGEALLRRWLDSGGPDAWLARFTRLFHEQRTPASILAEIDATGLTGRG